MTALARWAYALLLVVLMPFYLLRLLWRARIEPLYAHALLERFGIYKGAVVEGDWIWIHAVSLGETRAAAALIQALRAKSPSLKLLLTHGTATGRQAGHDLLREGDAQVWLPYDTPGAVKRFLKRFKPHVGVLMETEVWPQLLHQTRIHHVPMLIANGRLSERSLRRGSRFRLLLRPAAKALSLVMAQTEADAQRFVKAGVRKVIVCGNLKFDMHPDEGQLFLGQIWGKKLGRPVVLAASSREGEESPLLAAWIGARSTYARPAPLLVIVPRHPQRFDEVARLIQSTGLSWVRRSQWTQSPTPDAMTADVWLGDSMGEMPLYYSLAQLAFLGGSFAPFGGQNLIEAGACGCFVIMGPHTFNFDQAAQMALQAGVASRAPDINSAVSQGMGLLAHKELGALSEKASQFALAHGGASREMAKHILMAAQTTQR